MVVPACVTTDPGPCSADTTGVQENAKAANIKPPTSLFSHFKDTLTKRGLLTGRCSRHNAATLGEGLADTPRVAVELIGMANVILVAV